MHKKSAQRKGVAAKSPVARGPSSIKAELISKDLRKRVLAGEFVGRLPGVNRLAEEYGVYFQTADKAVAALVRDGLVYRQPRKGTFVTGRMAPRTHTLVAALGTDVVGSMHALLLQGILQAARQRGQRLLIRGEAETGPYEYDPQALDPLLDEKAVDGVVLWPLMPGNDSPAIMELRRRGIPFVAVVGEDPRVPFSYNYVINDDAWGTKLALNHLLDLGCRRIGFAMLSNQTVSDAHILPRHEAYLETLRERGVKCLSPVHVPVWGEEPGPFLRSLASMDAMLCSMDRSTTAFLRLAQTHRISIPGDLALVSYGDPIHMAGLGITAVRLPVEQIGRRAVEILIEVIEGRASGPVQEMMKPELIVRQSSLR